LPIEKYKQSQTGRNYKTLIIPSRESVNRHIQNLKFTLKKAVKREAKILQLNPKIIGWSNYYRSVVSAKLFNYRDHKVLQMVLKRFKKIHSIRSMT